MDINPTKTVTGIIARVTRIVVDGRIFTYLLLVSHPRMFTLTGDTPSVILAQEGDSVKFSVNGLNGQSLRNFTLDAAGLVA